MELDEAGGSQQQPGSSDGVVAPVITPEIITMPSRFETVQEKGNIDVWWLYDDGGKPLPLPLLLHDHVPCM